MKKIIVILFIIIILAGCSYAGSDKVEINGVDFEIPSKYSGGKTAGEEYRMDNVFSIRCIDDDAAGSIGLWAVEKDSSEDLNLKNHPVRHYCQYNSHVGDNHSHAYFASGESIYEIAWTGEEITRDIEKMIENTPESKIDEDAFYNALDASVKIYKENKISKLNHEAEYNYLEAKHSPQQSQNNHDDARFKQILFTYYLNRGNQ